MDSFDSELVDAFSSALLRELEALRRFIRPPYTLYVGGGTPTCIGDRLLRLLEEVLDGIGSEPVEFTVEANPATFDARLLVGLRSLGVNRLSVGVQSLSDPLLSLLGRPHTAKEALDALSCALEVFDNVNADVIFGIPGQTLGELEDTLRTLVDSGVSHVSAYGLSIEDGTPLKKMVEAGVILPVSDSTWERMYLFVEDFLSSEGFEHYEVSNYSKRGFRCLHNRLYWFHRPYVGLGPSACGFLGTVRYMNVASVEGYVRGGFCQLEFLDEEELVKERLMLGLRTSFGVPLRKLPGEWALRLREQVELADDGFLALEGGRLYVPSRRWPLLNAILARVIP